MTEAQTQTAAGTVPKTQAQTDNKSKNLTYYRAEIRKIERETGKEVIQLYKASDKRVETVLKEAEKNLSLEDFGTLELECKSSVFYRKIKTETSAHVQSLENAGFFADDQWTPRYEIAMMSDELFGYLKSNGQFAKTLSVAKMRELRRLEKATLGEEDRALTDLEIADIVKTVLFPEPSKPKLATEPERLAHQAGIRNSIARELFGRQYDGLNDSNKEGAVQVVASAVQVEAEHLGKSFSEEDYKTFASLEIFEAGDPRHKKLRKTLSESLQKQYDQWHGDCYRAKTRLIAKRQKELIEAEPLPSPPAKAEDDHYEERAPVAVTVRTRAPLAGLVGRSGSPVTDLAPTIELPPIDVDTDLDDPDCGPDDVVAELKADLKTKIKLLTIWINKETNLTRLEALADRLEILEKEFQVA